MLVHKFLMKAGSNVIASALSFISLMVMTRCVGEEYGVMMWGWAFTAIFNAFSDLGFNTSNMKYLSKRDADHDAYFSTFLFIKIVLSLAVTVMSSISVALTAMNGSMDSESVAVCTIFIVYYLIYNIQTALTVSFDGRLEAGKSSMALALEYGVRSTLLIILALMHSNACTLSMAYLVGIVLSMISCLYMMRNTGIRIVKPVFIKKYAIFAAPLAISIMAIAVIEYLDKVMIGLCQGSQEVGFYTAAFGVVAAFTTLGTSLNNVLLPHISKSGEHDHENIQNTLWMSEKYVSMLILPVLVFILVLGEPIATVLFGSGYAKSGDILSIQTIHIYMFILTGLMAQVLYSVNRASTYFRSSLIFVAIALVGYIVLIPEDVMGIKMIGLGSIGATIALSTAYLLFGIILIVFVKKEAGYTLYPQLWKQFVSGAVSGIFLVAVCQTWNPQGLIQLALSGLACEAVFLALLWMIKGISRDDVMFIKTAFSPRELHNSISEEWEQK